MLVLQQSPKMESPKKRKKKSVTAVQRTMLDFDEEATNVNPSATAAAAPQTEIDPQLAYAMECLTPAVRKRCCREWFYTTLDRFYTVFELHYIKYQGLFLRK